MANLTKICHPFSLLNSAALKKTKRYLKPLLRPRQVNAASEMVVVVLLTLLYCYSQISPRDIRSPLLTPSLMQYCVHGGIE